MDVEDAPPSKVPRVERKIGITDIKLHSRLNIYDFVGYDISLPGYFDDKYTHEPKDADSNFKMYGRIGHAAAVFGDLDALQCLNEIDENPLTPVRVDDKNYKLDDISYILARTQHWKGLKWAVEKGYSKTGWTMGAAIYGEASMKMLQWLHSKGCIADEATFEKAAHNSDMDIMKWLREIGCPWDEETFFNAVYHENLDMLMWLKKEGCPWSMEVFEEAAKTGNRDIMLWLRVEGCPWESCTFTAAIEGCADLFTLKWLHYEKCPWDKQAFIAAVKRGDLEILKWLREKQCPWDAECIHTAVENKNGKVLEWLRQEQCPRNEETHDMLMKYCISHMETCRLDS
jgi:hypothetical protein